MSGGEVLRVKSSKVQRAFTAGVPASEVVDRMYGCRCLICGHHAGSDNWCAWCDTSEPLHPIPVGDIAP